MIYFDNASTTLPSKNVLDEFVKCSKENFANPNSIHRLGVENNSKIERIKLEILKLLNLKTTDYEVVFTSGATEANNLAIQGFLKRNGKRFNHILTSKIEHSSVLEVFKNLEKQGFKVDYINVNSDGVLDLNDLKNHFDGSPVFCSFIETNNEIGTVNNLDEIRKIIGPNKILGVSAHNIKEAKKAKEDSADYLGVGAIFTTSTKDDANDVSIETLKNITESVDIPTVAIGGINLNNANKLKNTKIAGFSVVSAIMEAKNPQIASKNLKEIYENLE